MKKLLSACVIGMLSTQPILANDYHMGFAQQQQNSSYAGVYFKMPLQRDSRKQSRKLKYGFAMGMNKQMRSASFNSFTNASHNTVRLNMVELDMSDRGFEKFNMAGLPLLASNDHQTVWQLAGDGEEQTSAGTYVMYGAGILLGIGLLGALAASQSNSFFTPKK